jgi:hypothetical protein
MRHKREEQHKQLQAEHHDSADPIEFAADSAPMPPGMSRMAQQAQGMQQHPPRPCLPPFLPRPTPSQGPLAECQMRFHRLPVTEEIRRDYYSLFLKNFRAHRARSLDTRDDPAFESRVNRAAKVAPTTGAAPQSAAT